ncbi:MAG TPA: hypothetical protein PK718_08365 [Candidatus Methanofastidiosa archaeon]|nr:hypothetical protein [Candidatus Methanofastidiosa archaeon]
MNKKTLLVLGTFWIFVVALVSASSVAADGMYWGDSYEPSKPAFTVDEPLFIEPATDVPSFGDISFCILDGMYWGD